MLNPKAFGLDFIDFGGNFETCMLRMMMMFNVKAACCYSCHKNITFNQLGSNHYDKNSNFKSYFPFVFHFYKLAYVPTY
jgi:hypothetical protein